MPQFHGFVALVVVDGQPLPEYAINVNDETKEISCYIPSEVGKDFAIKWKDCTRQRNTSGSVKLDGVWAGAQYIFSRGSHRTERSSTRSSIILKQRTDDEDYVNSTGEQLGELRLDITALVKWDAASPSPGYWRSQQPPQDLKVHERSKKAITQCIGYGNDKTKLAQKIIRVEERGKRLATFVFRYGALGVLQARGIAPRPSPAPPAPQQNNKRNCEEQDPINIKSEPSDCDDEVDDDEQRLKMLKAEIERIEVRRSKRQKTAVKEESKPVIITNEIIDLT